MGLAILSDGLSSLKTLPGSHIFPTLKRLAGDGQDQVGRAAAVGDLRARNSLLSNKESLYPFQYPFDMVLTMFLCTKCTMCTRGCIAIKSLILCICNNL